MATIPPPEADRRLLRSWKAIAAHLQVDVRTVQRWATRTNIPIYRHQTQERGHPTAYADELDRWLTQHAGETHEPEAPAAPAVPRPARWRRFAIMGVVVSVAVLVVATVFVLRARRDGGVPSRCEVEHDLLRVYDISDRVLWSRPIAGLSDARRRATGYFSEESLIDDVNGDGRKEVILARPADVEREQSGRLMCFTSDGRDLWQFPLGRPQSWGGRTFNGLYEARLIRKVRGPSREYLLVSATHVLWYPNVVALLDPATGKLVEEYWHPGALPFCLLHDMDGDGIDEVVLSGINNPGQGLGHGAVVVLKVPFSRTPRHAGTDMAEFSGGREAAYLLFARPDLCSATGELPWVSEVAMEGDRLRARILCQRGAIFHFLSSGLEPVEARFSDNFFAFHEQLRSQGLIDHAMTPAEEACLKRPARFAAAVDGNGTGLSVYWKGCEQPVGR